LRPSDIKVKFCVGNENYSPNSRKAFIHAAFVSAPGATVNPESVGTSKTVVTIHPASATYSSVWGTIASKTSASIQLRLSTINGMVIFDSSDQTILVRLESETVWLTQIQMAELFGMSPDNVSLHLKNIHASNELEEIVTTEDYSVVRHEGTRRVKRQLKH
jgi:hypothetical protein